MLDAIWVLMVVHFISGGIRKFANLKKTYPYVDLYMGVLGSISAGNILWLNQQASRKTFIDLLITKMASYPEMSGVYLDFDGLTNLYQASTDT